MLKHRTGQQDQCCIACTWYASVQDASTAKQKDRRASEHLALSDAKLNKYSCKGAAHGKQGNRSKCLTVHKSSLR